jgi:hypothetical protein
LRREEGLAFFFQNCHDTKNFYKKDDHSLRPPQGVHLCGLMPWNVCFETGFSWTTHFPAGKNFIFFTAGKKGLAGG